MPPESTCSNLVMVALRSTEPVDWAAIADGFGAAPPDPAPEAQSAEVAAVTFPIGGGAVALAHVPRPIPWRDLEWPVLTAWHWPDAESELRAHASHLVMFARSSQLSAIELNLQLVRLVASVISACPSAGVYNGSASLVLEPARYREEAQGASEESLPITLWLGLHPVTDDDGLSGYTTGMDVFGLLNLEVHDAAIPPDQLLGLLANVAHYEIGAAVQIGDGETVGGSAEERIEIWHRPSRFGAHAITCHLVLPPTAA